MLSGARGLSGLAILTRVRLGPAVTRRSYTGVSSLSVPRPAVVPQCQWQCRRAQWRVGVVYGAYRTAAPNGARTGRRVSATSWPSSSLADRSAHCAATVRTESDEPDEARSYTQPIHIQRLSEVLLRERELVSHV